MNSSIQGGVAVLERPKKIDPATFSLLSREDKLESVAQMFEGRAKEPFHTVKGIDDMDEDVLRAMSVDGNGFEPIAEYLAGRGIITKTIGGVMDALELTKNDAHDLLCFCREQLEMETGESIAWNIQFLIGRIS